MIIILLNKSSIFVIYKCRYNEAMEYTVVRKNKTYKNRKLVIYSGKKKICNVTPWMGWCCYDYYIKGMSKDPEKHLEVRKVVMENLYWLLGQDCDKEAWIESVEAWNTGKHVYGVPVDQLQSMFNSEDERLTAIESFYNV